MSITTKIKGDEAYLYTPYNNKFVSAIKGIGGAYWDRDSRAWVIPADMLDQARKIMLRIYGESDIPTDSEKVSAELTFNKSVSRIREAITIYGKTICRAYGRDGGGNAGEDVAFIEGKPESGGSVRNWTSDVPQGSIVVLRNVPKMLLNEKLPEGVSARIFDNDTTRNELLAEKEKLLDRIAEIDKLLGEMA